MTEQKTPEKNPAEKEPENTPEKKDELNEEELKGKGYIPAWKVKKMKEEFIKAKQEKEELQRAKNKEEEEKLLKQKNYEELISKKDNELKTVSEKLTATEARIKKTYLNLDLAILGQKTDAVEPRDLLKFIDEKKIEAEYDEENDVWVFPNLENLVAELKEKKPYLFGKKEEKKPNPAENNRSNVSANVSQQSGQSAPAKGNTPYDKVDEMLRAASK